MVESLVEMSDPFFTPVTPARSIHCSLSSAGVSIARKRSLSSLTRKVLETTMQNVMNCCRSRRIQGPRFVVFLYTSHVPGCCERTVTVKNDAGMASKSRTSSSRPSAGVGRPVVCGVLNARRPLSRRSARLMTSSLHIGTGRAACAVVFVGERFVKGSYGWQVVLALCSALKEIFQKVFHAHPGRCRLNAAKSLSMHKHEAGQIF